MRVNAGKKQISLLHPSLPESLPEVTIRNLRVDGAKVDIVLERYRDTVGLKVPRREGKVEIVVVT